MAAATSTAGNTVTGPGPVPGVQMRAIVQTQYGGTEVLSSGEVDRPSVGATEVLVRVHAAGLDRGTWHLMTGLPLAIRLAGYGVRAPKSPVPGSDLSGVVVAVGEGVTRFQPGDAVYGCGKGSLAEYAAAEEGKLALKPASLTFEQAAALPTSGATALTGLTDVGHLEAGQRVLVIGASGGVGSHAVQIAKALGAHVTGVCSTSKVDLVRSLGADDVIDYTSEDFALSVTSYDLILDIGGNTPISRLRRVLSPTGTLVISGGETSGRFLGGADRQLRAIAVSPFLKQRLTTFVAKPNAAAFERLTTLVEDGHLVPAIERTFALSEVPTAMRHLESGRTRGKLVITI